MDFLTKTANNGVTREKNRHHYDNLLILLIKVLTNTITLIKLRTILTITYVIIVLIHACINKRFVHNLNTISTILTIACVQSYCHFPIYFKKKVIQDSTFLHRRVQFYLSKEKWCW
ncbi:hypothetical protein EGW08_008413 [Elysia chlorotica]|uniref:Uncharacterized protein n=1 Tax=Elysia chlorotica TaxID=188477 RepID=A0A433TQE3_ELYCH|nr:hypothetical protein EGW08_008413 [Elysia chlorotica]